MYTVQSQHLCGSCIICGLLLVTAVYLLYMYTVQSQHLCGSCIICGLLLVTAVYLLYMYNILELHPCVVHEFYDECDLYGIATARSVELTVTVAFDVCVCVCWGDAQHNSVYMYMQSSTL